MMLRKLVWWSRKLRGQLGPSSCWCGSWSVATFQTCDKHTNSPKGAQSSWQCGLVCCVNLAHQLGHGCPPSWVGRLVLLRQVVGAGWSIKLLVQVGVEQVVQDVPRECGPASCWSAVPSWDRGKKWRVGESYDTKMTKSRSSRYGVGIGPTQLTESV